MTPFQTVFGLHTKKAKFPPRASRSTEKRSTVVYPPSARKCTSSKDTTKAQTNSVGTEILWA